MAGKSGQKALEPYHKDFLVELFALNLRPLTVQRQLEEEYGINVSITSVIYYRDTPKWKAKILEKRKAMMHDFASIPYVTKRERLALRSRLIEDLLDNLWVKRYTINGKDHPDRLKIKKDKEGQPIWHKLRGHHGEINKILDSIQSEMADLEADMEIDPMAGLEEEHAGTSDEELTRIALEEVKKYMPPGTLDPSMEVKNGRKNGVTNEK